ncbi:MAG: tail fiber domain-containing protein [Candidatus Paceibacterota bacterium]
MLLLSAFCLPNEALAAFNEQINYQGKLFSSTSIAVADGDYNFTFRLYTAASGGSPIWTEECTTTNRVNVRSGLFSHMLGSVNSLSDTIFNQDLYLSVDVGGTTTIPSWDGEMSPRKHLGSVASAFEAKRLGGKTETQFATLAEGETITGSWTHQNSLVISSSTAATLFTITQNGAGTAAEIMGKVAIATSTANAQLTVQGTSTTALVSILTAAGNSALFASSSGFVGINTSTPSYNLDVAGDINISGALRIAGSDLSQYFIDSAGTSGQLWSSDGAGRGDWLSTSSLGLSMDYISGSSSLAYLSGNNIFTGYNIFASTTFNGTSTFGDVIISNLTSTNAHFTNIVGFFGANCGMDNYAYGINPDGTLNCRPDVSGGGGVGGGWATTSDNKRLYPANVAHIVIIGGNVTSSQNTIFETIGNAYIKGNLRAESVTTSDLEATNTTLLNILNVTGPTQLASTTINGTTTMANATATSFGITGNLNVAGQSTLGNVSSSNVTISGALTWSTNSGLLEAVSGAVRATSTANFLTTGNASALYVPYTYASSVFSTYAYNTSTFVTYSYGSSTYATTNHTHAQLHDPVTENILGIDLTGQTLSLTSGYFIPTTSPAFASVTTTDLYPTNIIGATNVSTTNFTASGNTVLANATGTNLNLTGALFINGNNLSQFFIDSAGTLGQLWASDGSGVGHWVNTSTLGLSYTDLRDNSNLALLNANNTFTGTNTFASTTINGTTTMANATATNLGITSNLNVAGQSNFTTASGTAITLTGNQWIGGALYVTDQTSLGNASTTNLTVSNNSYLGTIKSGTWNGSIIGAAYLGSGSPSANTLLFGDGAWKATSTLGLSYTDLRDNSNLALLNANNTFTGTNTFASTSTLATTSITKLSLSGALLDAASSTGSFGMLLQSTATSTRWIATSALGLGGSASAAGDTGQLQFNSASAFAATSVLYWDNSVGSLSIGTSTLRYGQLFVGDRNPSLALSRDIGDTLVNFYIQNNYLYALGTNFTIIDITNPATTSVVTSSNAFTGGQIVVQGKYAYIGTSNSFQIVDISNPANPVLIVNEGTWPSGSNTRVAVGGKYLYTTNQGYQGFAVYDISNVYGPKQIYISGSLLSNASNVSVQGDRLYITDWDALHIYDISNPSAPVALTGFTYTSNGSEDMKIQGRYAYLMRQGTLQIYDIATTTPYLIGSKAGAGNVWSLDVQGRYAYVDEGTGFSVYDISNPSNIIKTGSISLTSGVGVKVQGRYAFVGDGTNLKSLDLGGAFLQQLEAGAVLTGGLDVAGNANFDGYLVLGKSLSVGPGGIFSQGSLGIMASGTSPTTSIFSVGSDGFADIIVANADGKVGIGTSSPETKLQIVGTTTAWNIIPDMNGSSGNVSTYNLGASTTRWNSLWVSTTYIGPNTWQISQQSDNRLSILSSPAGSERFSILSAGNIGIGTTSPSYNFAVSGTLGITGAFYDNFSTSGANGMVLQTTGSGFKWVATSTLGLGGGSGTPAGVDGSIQYKSDTNFAGESSLFWDSTSKRLGIGTSSPTSSLEILETAKNPTLSISAYVSGTYSPTLNFNTGAPRANVFRILYDATDAMGKILSPTAGAAESINVSVANGFVGIYGDPDATTYELKVNGDGWVTGDLLVGGNISASTANITGLLTAGSANILGQLDVWGSSYFHGDIYVSGTPYWDNGVGGPWVPVPSDSRLKVFEANLTDSAMGIIEALHPIQFRYNKTGQDLLKLQKDISFYGFYADEFQNVIPQFVIEKQGYRWIVDPGMNAILTAAIQEQQDQIKKFESDIVNSNLSEGDIVYFSTSTGEVIKTNRPYQTEIFGVAAMGGKIVPFGRAKVKVGAENGEIKKGDYITSGINEGIGIKATSAGRILGMALENMGTSSQSLIEVYINPQWSGNDLSIQTNIDGQIINNPAVSSLRNQLTDIGLIVGEDGTLEVKALKAQKVITNEFETIDKATGQTYCLWIENGDWKKVSGACQGTAAAVLPLGGGDVIIPPSPEQNIANTSSASSSINVDALTVGSPATTTDSVVPFADPATSSAPIETPPAEVPPVTEASPTPPDVAPEVLPPDPINVTLPADLPVEAPIQ